MTSVEVSEISKWDRRDKKKRKRMGVSGKGFSEAVKNSIIKKLNSLR